MTLSALISGGTSLLGSLFGGDDEYSGPSPEQILEQAYGMGRETFDPYIQRGHTAQDRASTQYNRMSESPMDFLNEIIAGYSPSQGYKFREQKALEAARNSAAQGGISGTHNDQLGQAEMVSGLLDQDMQQWLQNVLGIQTTGLQGLENTANRGFGASQSLADLLGNISGSQAGLAYNRQQADRDRTGNIIGGLSGLLGTGAGALFGSSAGNSGTPLTGTRNINNLGQNGRGGGLRGNWGGNIGQGMQGGNLGAFNPGAWGRRG